MTSSDRPFFPDERQRLLQSFKALIFKWGLVHFKSFFDKLDDQLMRMADKAGSNIEQNHYLHARSEIRTQRRNCEKQLLDHMRQAFDNFLNRQPTAADSTHNDMELQLVNNDQLEQSIAIANMNRRANAEYSEAIYALNQRLSALAGGRKIDDFGNPIAPGVFCDAIHRALQHVQIDTAPKLVCYKIYDVALLQKLDKLYHLLNHHLKTAGVLPHLRYQIRKEEVALPAELATHNSPATLSKQTDLMSLVQQLQHAQSRQQAPVKNPIPLQQILVGLQPVQRHSAEQLTTAKSQTAVLHTDYNTLSEEIKNHTRKAASVDADVIEIVGLLFNYMLNDEQLPDSVKALLSYLHTPFLKVALLDKAFFNSPQHPARQLLNALVAAGERWVEAEGKHKSDVYQRMKEVVQRILDDFDNDVRLFSQLAFDFNHYLRQHARRVQLSEQRALQAARGEDKLKEIRLRVERYLQKKIGDDALPASVQKLLFEPWANFLAFNLLRFGSNSEQWQTAAQVVSDILTYLRPQGLDAGQQQKLRETIDTQVTLGFQTVGYEAEAGKKLLDNLHQAHRERISAGAETAVQRSADIDAPITPASEIAANPALSKLGKLEFGTWFVFHADRPRKDQVQAKLAWANELTQHYMFVNRLGQQVAVKSGNALATEIEAGHTRIADKRESVPFFERALERIVEQLRPRTPR